MKLNILYVIFIGFLMLGCESIEFDFSDDNHSAVSTHVATNDNEAVVTNNSNDNETNLSDNTDENETTTTDNNEDNQTDTNDTINTSEIRIPSSELNETIAKEWYVRIVVEDVTNNMKTASAQLGQLDGSDVVQKHTLKAIAPFRPTYLDVVFDNPVGVDPGSYTTNFHLSGNGSDSWEFTVKSHDPNADMILGWRGLYVISSYIDAQNRKRYREHRTISNPLLLYMVLEDTETNTTIPVLSNSTVNEYVFNMSGKTTRVFRWKVQDTSTPLSSALVIDTSAQRLKKLQIEALRKDAKSKPDALEKRRVEALDMMTPPKFEVLVK